MSHQHSHVAILTSAHGELFANLIDPVPRHLCFPIAASGMPPGDLGYAVPITGGVAEALAGEMTGRELRGYLDYGMAFSGIMKFQVTEHGLQLAEAHGLKSIVEPKGLVQDRLDAVLTVAEQLASYRNARLRAGIDLSIADWQGEARDNKATPDHIRLTIRAEDQRLLLTTADGRKLDLELEDGTLRALAYEADEGKQAPVITALPERGDILTDREDYDRETRYESEDPAL